MWYLLIPIIFFFVYIYYFKNKNNNEDFSIEKEADYSFNAYFGKVNLDGIVLKYKNTKICYSDLEKYLKKYLTIPNDLKLISYIMENNLFPIIPENNRNRIIDYLNIIKFTENNNIEEYFKDWVKQAEHPEIKNFAWLLAEKGILLKKKEKNRVYYKYKEGADVNKIFEEVFKAKDKAVENFIIFKLIESIADKEADYIEIENSLFDLGKEYIGIYKKLDTPLIVGCEYCKYYSIPKNINKTSNFPTIRSVLEEIIHSKRKAK